VPTIYCLHRIGAVRLMILEDRIHAEKTTGLRADPGVTRREVRKLALASRDYLEYPDLAEYAVGARLRHVVTAMVLLGQIGTCSAYVIFMANNLMHMGALVPAVAALPRYAYCVVLLPFLAVLSFVRTLKGLMPVAIVGVALLFAGLAVVGVHGVADAQVSGHALALPPMFLGEGIVVFIGMALFSLESVNAMPSLQASMTKPAQFPTVLNTASVLLVLLYIGVGLGGAVLFGAGTHSIITQNMVGAGAMGHAARVLFVSMLLVSFPFQMFPAAVIAERTMGGLRADDVVAEASVAGGSGGNGGLFATGAAGAQSVLREGSAAAFSGSCSRLVRNFYVVRIALCCVVVAIGIMFTDFGMFLSLIGYPCMGTLGLVIPPLMCISMDARSKRKGGRMRRVDRFVCWSIMLLGAVACILGTVYSIAEVIRVERAAGLEQAASVVRQRGAVDGGGAGAGAGAAGAGAGAAAAGSSSLFGAAAGMAADRDALSGSSLLGKTEQTRPEVSSGVSAGDEGLEEPARPRAAVAGSGAPESDGTAGRYHHGRVAAFGNIQQLVDLYGASNQGQQQQ
jgi:amino acid permease